MHITQTQSNQTSFASFFYSCNFYRLLFIFTYVAVVWLFSEYLHLTKMGWFAVPFCILIVVFECFLQHLVSLEKLVDSESDDAIKRMPATLLMKLGMKPAANDPIDDSLHNENCQEKVQISLRQNTHLLPYSSCQGHQALADNSSPRLLLIARNVTLTSFARRSLVSVGTKC